MPYRDLRGIGYAGWVKLKTSSGDIPCPVTSCTLEKTPGKIIPDNLIHGSSGDEAASQVIWAWGANAYGGDIETYLFKALWQGALSDWLLNDRITPINIVASPDNYNVWLYKNCYTDNFRISGNVPTGVGGTPITLTLHVLATGRESSTEAPPTFTGFFTADENLNDAPIPGWRARVEYAGFKGPGGEQLYPTAWEIAVNHRPTVLYVADGRRDPKWIKQGIMNVTGSVTLYHPDGVPLPEDSVVESSNKNGSLKIFIYGQQEIDSESEGTLTKDPFLTIEIPYVVITSYAQNFAAPANPVVRTVNFTGLGSAIKKAISITVNP